MLDCLLYKVLSFIHLSTLLSPVMHMLGVSCVTFRESLNLLVSWETYAIVATWR